MQHQSCAITTRKQAQTKFKNQQEQLCSQPRFLVWLSTKVLTATPENTVKTTDYSLWSLTFFPIVPISVYLHTFLDRIFYKLYHYTFISLVL